MNEHICPHCGKDTRITSALSQMIYEKPTGRINDPLAESIARGIEMAADTERMRKMPRGNSLT